MTDRIQHGLRAVENWSDRQWREFAERLRIAGLLPASSEDLEPVAGVVQEHAFDRVEPSRAFREDLRKNLTIAAQLRNSGLVVEYPKPIREIILLGTGVAFLIACITTLILVFRSRGAGARPSA